MGVNIRVGYKVLRAEGAKEFSPGFQPWVLATQKCALKVALE